MTKRLILFLLLNILTFETWAQQSISINQAKTELSKAAEFLNKNLKDNLTLKAIGTDANIIVFTKDDIVYWTSAGITLQQFSAIESKGYAYKWSAEKKTLYILALESTGASNGIIDLGSELVNKSFYEIEEKVFKPSFEYRIIKFNLPWSPYRDNEATTLHYETCKDLKFWESYLDMMVENHFNVLSLWNIHPFSFMIKSKNFPLANSFSETEMEEWRVFWKSLFKMAKERNIETFIVNWNIAVSPEFAKAYDANQYSDLSENVKKYTKESVTQVIDEYPNLTGIGVTLADWMGTFDDKMTPQQREDWIEETFVAGMKEAKRQIKFLHRSVLAGDPLAMRNLLNRADLQEPALMEIKFNWSHGHSTPNLAITHDYHSGKLDERFWSPKPLNYNIQWMVRNEDFFILRWGQPDFIREHIKINSHDYVNGYFIGSEGFIPAKDYSHIDNEDKNWTYAFEKQWLFYKAWGQLLYNSETSDNFFVDAFKKRYGDKAAQPLFQAYSLVSKMPLKLASFHRSTWDYTLYSEGFLEAAPSSPDGFFDGSSPFISIDELINHETLDPMMISIPDYVQKVISKEILNDSIINPLKLADELQKDSQLAMELMSHIDIGEVSGLKSEIEDAAVWAHLGLYFGLKLQAGVSLETFRQTGILHNKKIAIQYLEKCLIEWQEIVKLTAYRYNDVPHVATERNMEGFDTFSWHSLTPQVERDIEIAKSSKRN
jgi:hypothetical protein